MGLYHFLVFPYLPVRRNRLETAPDWCKSATQKENGSLVDHDHTEAGDLIPVYQPVVLGDKVFLYYCATRQSTAVPKIERFSPMDAK